MRYSLESRARIVSLMRQRARRRQLLPVVRVGPGIGSGVAIGRAAGARSPSGPARHAGNCAGSAPKRRRRSCRRAQAQGRLARARRRSRAPSLDRRQGASLRGLLAASSSAARSARALRAGASRRPRTRGYEEARRILGDWQPDPSRWRPSLPPGRLAVPARGHRRGPPPLRWTAVG
jgi:hypothetical protein